MVGLIVFGATGKSEATGERDDNKAAQRAHGGREYLGVRQCVRCHFAGVDKVEIPIPGGGTMKLADDQWVLYKEYADWVRHDKHGQAFTVLLNERSRAMGKLLGSAEMHRDLRCLACHTGFPVEQMAVGKDGLVGKDLIKQFDVNLGVSCEGCHGPAGDRKKDGVVLTKGWLVPHEIQPVPPLEKSNAWRFLAPRTKKDDYGFADVRSPLGKAQICASCHIGDVGKGRLLTHEMYAAGHPPLPGLEIETFVRQMPQHWRELPDKADKVRKDFLQFTRDPLFQAKVYRAHDLARTRSLLVGALVALASHLKLTADLAGEAVATAVPRPDWPEYAQFECFACHHELKNPGWRRERRRLAVAGRPMLREWPTALVPSALRTAGVAEDELTGRLAGLERSLSARPFGVRAEMRGAAAVASWLLAQAEIVQAKPVSAEEGAKLLDEIAARACDETMDYDSARQFVWAFEVAAEELRGKLDRYPKEFEAFARGREWKERLPAARKILDDFGKKMFLLDLRDGRQARTMLPGEKEARKIVEVDLTKVWPFVGEYEPERFRERFREVRKVLEGGEER